MYYTQYARRLDEIEARQKARPKKSVYKDKDGHKHPATIMQLATYEAIELLGGEPSPIVRYQLDERAAEATPILASIFELTHENNKRRRQKK